MTIESDFRKAAKEMFLAIRDSSRHIGGIHGQMCGSERYVSTVEYNGFRLSEWEDALRNYGIILDKDEGK